MASSARGASRGVPRGYRWLLGLRVWLRRGLAFVALALPLAPTSISAQLTAVDDAADVCPPTANPCVVNQEVQIVDGAVLDFGLRTLAVGAGGVLDSGAGTVRVRCGRFIANTGPEVAIRARGPSGQGTIDGGSFELDVVRACVADAQTACFADAGCRMGSCTEAGTCEGDPLRSCAAETDCDLGPCTVGGGADVNLNGRVRADGNTPGAIVIRAAGNIALRELVDVDAAATVSDGGTLEVVSEQGSVTINGKVEATGGGFAQGGSVSLFADQAVTINAIIDVGGGDFDGGFIEIDAGRDVLVNGDLRAAANNGAGSGGDISISSGNDIVIADLVALTVNGNQARAGGSGGDGGTIDCSAGRDLVVGDGAFLLAEGAEADGSGEAILLSAGQAMRIAARVSARARGTEGAGGTIECASGGVLDVGPAATFDLRGGALGGGDVLLSSAERLQFEGAIISDASNGGTGDTIRLEAGGELIFSGSASMGGQTSEQGFDGGIELQGCSIDLQAGGTLTNSGTLGVNTLAANNEIFIRRSATVLAATPFGKNRLVLGTSAPAPLVQGAVDPTPEVVVDPALTPCRECGNGRMEDGETCDDGNSVPGDGCSENCQDEHCIAQTLNWPAAPLCDDDVPCTRDFCDTTIRACVHVLACDDGLGCTIDRCENNVCVHDADSRLCDDANICTSDVCTESAGCVNFDKRNQPCDDGLDCTLNDACTDGRCRGTKDCAETEFCSKVTGDCVDGSTTTTTTTTTTTLQAPVCGDGMVEGDEDCDDGDAPWSVGEPCNEQCRVVGCADPDDSGSTTASDALVTLRTAIGAFSCAVCLCDVDNSKTITATDALVLLRAAVGLSASPLCPPCF